MVDHKKAEVLEGIPARLVMGTRAEVSPLSARATASSAAYDLDYLLPVEVEGAEKHPPRKAVEAAPALLAAFMLWAGGGVLRALR
jgi:hypothetical protein